MNTDFFRRTFLSNTIEEYCWFLGIILTGFILKELLSRLFTRVIFRMIKKYSSGIGFERLLELLKRPVGAFIIMLTFYVAFTRIDFPAEWDLAPKEVFGLRMVIFKCFQSLIILSVVWIILRTIDFFGLILFHRAALTVSKTDDQLVAFVKDSMKIIVVIFSVFFILGTVFEVNVASLIAGLGIGGLAVALAAKDSLENLFGSFTIFLDKPFSIGDTVKVGNVIGEVERIGFRSTRIRTPEKSFVTIPNKKMVDAELDNLTWRTQRKAKYTFGIGAEIGSEKIKSILSDMQQHIKNEALIKKDDFNVCFFEITANSAMVHVEFNVVTRDTSTYMKVREDVNLKIMEIVFAHGGKFL